MKIVSSSIYLLILVIIKTLGTGNNDFAEAGTTSSRPFYVPLQNVERITDIAKSPHDKRSYRGLVLSNNLKVLLISDSTAVIDAVAMAVNVGSMNQPKELPGLARLLECLLLRQSKVYPKMNEFEKYVFSRDGFINSYTTGDTQNYHFEIMDDYFVTALKRFAEFFREPVINPLAVEREIMMINSQYILSESNNDNRIIQLQKLLSKENHSYNHFHIGNLETLSTIPKSKGISITDKLMEFYSTWYSSHMMCLVVIAPDPLNELEKTILPLFEKIQSKVVPEMLDKDEHPWGPEQLKHKIYVVPFARERMIRLVFATPDISDQYRTAPEKYVAELIERQGPESLFSELYHIRNLCIPKLNGSGLLATYGTIFKTGMFLIECNLSEEGVDRVDEIISVIFEYIQLLKKNGIQEWIFKEKSKLGEWAFKYKEKENSLDYAASIASLMTKHPMEDVLTYPFLRDHWEPLLVEEFLSYLTPDNMNVFIVSETFEEIANEKEQWYGTKYKIESIDDELIKRWRTTDSSHNIRLPHPNKFIPANFDLHSFDEDDLERNLQVIKESTISKFWFKQDLYSNIPKINVQFEVISPMSNLNVKNRSLLEILVLNLRVWLKEIAYDAEVMGYEWNIFTSPIGIQVELFGYNDKMPLLLRKLASIIKVSDVHEAEFKLFKQLVIRFYKIFHTQEPRIQSQHYLSYLINEFGWTYDELSTAMEDLQYDDFVKFVLQLFSHVFIRGLIYGNCNKQTATEIASILETPFHSAKAFSFEEFSFPRQMKLPDGSNFFYQIPVDRADSSYYVYFQIDTGGTVQCPHYVLELFVQIVQGPCHHVLENNEQLGYVVICDIHKGTSALGFTILVQSDKHPVYINSKIEQFLRTVYDLLFYMTKEQLERYKRTLDASLRQGRRSTTMKSKSTQYWNYISPEIYKVGVRQDVPIDRMYALNKLDLLQFFEKYFDEYSTTRRKLAIHAVSQLEKTRLPDSVIIEASANKILDATSFKNTMEYFTFPLMAGASSST